MGTYVTSAGLAIPSVQDLLAKMSQEQRDAIDALLNTDPDSPVGQLNGIVSSHLREAWEVLQLAFHGMDPDQAEGALLDQIGAITGTKRAKATPSTFTGTRQLDVTMGANAKIPAGSLMAVSGAPLIQFLTTQDVTSVAAGSYKVPAKCTQTGPIPCNANTLTVIVNPVVGWNGVNNAYDAILGQAEDLDPGYRLRREAELRATGAANPDSLRADLLAITIDGADPVLDVHVFFNDTDLVNSDGLPPHSLECLVFDGLAQAVPNDTLAQVIWNGKPGGVQMMGSASGVAVDSLGNKQTVRFSRPVVKDIAFQFTLAVNPDTYAGTPAVQAAIVAQFLAKVSQGSVIRCNDYVGTLMSQTGITDIPNGIQITFNGTGYPAAGVNLVLGLRQMGNIQASWVNVTTV